jgi:hypothetical protein
MREKPTKSAIVRIGFGLEEPPIRVAKDLVLFVEQGFRVVVRHGRRLSGDLDAIGFEDCEAARESQRFGKPKRG